MLPSISIAVKSGAIVPLGIWAFSSNTEVQMIINSNIFILSSSCNIIFYKVYQKNRELHTDIRQMVSNRQNFELL